MRYAQLTGQQVTPEQVVVLSRLCGPSTTSASAKRANLAEALALLESFRRDEPPREGDGIDDPPSEQAEDWPQRVS